ncbi:MAG: sugar ABC transporter permease [Anaerolineae bacterium]|nr:sugar ABC transporter permease [Anaerolineae bacterium]
MHMSRMQRREALEAYVFISPWVIGMLLFVGGPILASAFLSLTDWSLLAPMQFVGTANYVRLLTNDPLFWKALRVTGIYTFAHVPLAIMLGFSIALMLNQPLRFVALWRTIYYLPAVVSGVAVALLWLWVFNPELGLANRLLDLFGIEPLPWFMSTRWALPTLIIVSLWGVGGGMVIYLAGLQGIPTDLYEAAHIDGAGMLRRFLSITIPMMTPVLFFQLIMGIINTLQVFTNAYVMTAGGPANATLFYVLYLYLNAFSYFKMGYAAAMAWILFLIILLLTVLVFWSSSRWVYYEAEERGAR